jgi:secondary thiamine-phosphate synthase enzyme
MRSATQEIVVRAERRLSCVDLTDELKRAIKDSGVVEGCAVAFSTHTTCALIINEWEDGALDDLKCRLEELIPDGIYYAHDDFEKRTQNIQENERINGHAHVASMIVGGSSHAIPVAGGDPMLGAWQRLFLLELDEPKDRKVIFHIFGG